MIWKRKVRVSSLIFFQPWLGTGLLTSTHQKWKTRRKLLTPAFHFRILDDALEAFNAQGQILAEVLEEDSKNATDNTIDIFNYVTRCTLDIILETAMGQQLGIQLARQSDYCDTINAMVHVMQQRQIQPHLQNEYTFRWVYIKSANRQKPQETFTNYNKPFTMVFQG